jgi:archaellum biogenesis ATPase FlaH
MDNLELNLLASTLRTEHWEKIKNFITPQMFPKEWRSIAQAITEAHLKYDNIELLDAKTVHAVHGMMFPAMPDSKGDEASELITSLCSVPEMDDNLAYDYAKKFWQRSMAKQIGEKAVQFWVGDDENAFSDIAKLMDRVTNNSMEGHETFTIVKDTFEELMESTSKPPEFLFGVPTLEEHLPGMNRGDFGIIFARPEVGKTSFCSHLVAQYLAQGKKVHYWANEELAKKVKLRITTAFFGVDKYTLVENKHDYKETYDSVIGSNLVVIDSVGTPITELGSFTALNKPDVILIDQLDKVKINGDFGRGDERLKELYVAGRELAKRNNCLVWAVSQANYEAHQREIIDFSMMDNSRTGKAGEADVILGIGKGLGVEDNTRFLTISKNKVNGWHGTAHAFLDIATGKYYV